MSVVNKEDFRFLLYLISLGVVAMATVTVFFGLGFLLLAHPNEEQITSPNARDRGAEVEPQRADLLPSADKDATQSASAPSIFPALPQRHYDVLSPASEDKATGSVIAAHTGAANSTLSASSGQDLGRLMSTGDQTTLARPAGITRTERTRIDRHRHAVVRKHWAGLPRPGVDNRPPPPAISGPERAWHWIRRSATDILAALSPSSSRQAPGFKAPRRAD
jgi:hypothetical protein